jgi:hypothetical protein
MWSLGKIQESQFRVTLSFQFAHQGWEGTGLGVFFGHKESPDGRHVFQAVSIEKSIQGREPAAVIDWGTYEIKDGMVRHDSLIEDHLLVGPFHRPHHVEVAISSSGLEQVVVDGIVSKRIRHGRLIPGKSPPAVKGNYGLMAFGLSKETYVLEAQISYP